MNETMANVIHEHLPFYITAPSETDILFGAVTIALIAIVVAFGALYFSIQAIPDRIAEGTSKTQMQLVGLLGLISLFTMNNLYWVAAILLAAIRVPDFMTPLRDIAGSLRSRSESEAKPAVSDIREAEERPGQGGNAVAGDEFADETADGEVTTDD